VSIELDKLWNFANPAASERALRDALSHATGDDALILKTQIARTHGMRRHFDEAARLLRELEPALASAGPLPRAYHALESGRVLVSTAHPAGSITPDARFAAHDLYLKAIEQAAIAADDAVAIDAMHMLAIVETDPEAQLRWNFEALELARESDQPKAIRWEASLRHNIGCALSAAHRHEEALAHFRAAADLRAEAGEVEENRIARWMVAKTLRALGQIHDALDMQQELESEHAAHGKADPYVFEELEIIHRSLGDAARAADYAARRRAHSPA
jgi:tetratricopeptide (TPR) repeat protein